MVLALPRDVLVLLDVTDVHRCNKVDFPYLLFCVPSLFPPFIPFSLFPLHLESALHGMKDLLFMLLGFRRHASLRDRSPASSEPYVTLDSRSSLNRTTFGTYSFLPRFPLESISYSPDFEVYLKNFVSQIRCDARRDNVLAVTFREN